MLKIAKILNQNLQQLNKKADLILEMKTKDGSKQT